MKRLNGFHLALLIVLVANAAAAFHAVRNRTGRPVSEIEMTDRELPYTGYSENKPVFLHLSYRTPAISPGNSWIGERELREIGFDCSLPPNAKGAYDFYSGQLPRRALVALEYEGEAWKALEEVENALRLANPEQYKYYTPQTRLVVAGVGKDVASLRRRFPDRSKVVLLPAVVRASSDGARLLGSFTDVPTQIYVPREFARGFHTLPPRGRNQGEIRYKVRLRYGANLEPWILSVEFLQ